MAALMAAATLLTMSIFATILPHMRYTSMLVVEPMFQKAIAIKQDVKPYFQTTSSSPASIICFFSHFLRRMLISGN